MAASGDAPAGAGVEKHSVDKHGVDKHSGARVAVDTHTSSNAGASSSVGHSLAGVPLASIPLSSSLSRLLVAAALVVADLWSKAAVFAWLSPRPEGVGRYDSHGHWRHEIFGDWFAFYLTTNPGMAWGLKLPPWLLVSGRCVAVLFLAWLVVSTPRERRVLAASLTLIFAGATGNLYDNLFVPPFEGAQFGEVRDFIDVYFAAWDWHFPTFNVADACISVGALLLLASSFLTSERPAEELAVQGAQTNSGASPR